MADRRPASGRTIVILIGGALLLLLVSGAPVWRAGANAQIGVAATATRQAELLELARLQTEVASQATALPTAVDAALRGRLGGTRPAFDARYGAPIRYLAEDQLEYRVEGFGQTIVTIRDDRARRIVLAPARPLAKPIRDPDPADWTVAAAQAAANRFLPADAIWEPWPAPIDGEATATGSSAALTGAFVPVSDACLGAGAASASFTARLTMPTERTVSLVTLDLVPARGSDGTSTGPTTGSASAVATSGADDGSTSVNVSIGGANGEDGAPGADGAAATGTGGQGGQGGDGGQGGADANVQITISGGNEGAATANGVRVRLLGQQRSATGVVAPPAGTTFVALDVAIENRSDDVLRFDLANFRLSDTSGRDHASACGGPAPAITSGELAVGQTVRGWIAFAVPMGVVPDQFTYEIAPGVTVNFAVD